MSRKPNASCLVGVTFPVQVRCHLLKFSPRKVAISRFAKYNVQTHFSKVRNLSFRHKNLVVSNELLKVELPPWKDLES